MFSFCNSLEVNINPQYIKNSGISFAGVELNEFQKVFILPLILDIDEDTVGRRNPKVLPVPVGE